MVCRVASKMATNSTERKTRSISAIQRSFIRPHERRRSDQGVQWCCGSPCNYGGYPRDYRHGSKNEGSRWRRTRFGCVDGEIKGSSRSMESLMAVQWSESSSRNERTVHRNHVSVV